MTVFLETRVTCCSQSPQKTVQTYRQADDSNLIPMCLLMWVAEQYFLLTVSKTTDGTSGACTASHGHCSYRRTHGFFQPVFYDTQVRKLGHQQSAQQKKTPIVFDSCSGSKYMT